MIPMQYMSLMRRGIVSVLLVALAWGSVGCGLPVQWQNMASKLPESTPEDPVYEIICIWQPAEGQDPKGQHTRGFAGQICFFTRRQETSVRVNGDVMISVYDDQGKPEDRGKPLHNWEFIGDAWKIHLHDGNFGPTYSVFIPYSRKTQNQAQCALRVRFTPENGKPIYSNTAAVILPGQLRKKAEEPVDAKPKGDPRKSLKSLTIPLKEKRKKRFSELRIGESSMERVVAPVSELTRRAVRNGRSLPTQNATASAPVTPARSPVIPSLPSPPPQTLPRAIMPAKPIPRTQPTRSTQPRSVTEVGFRASGKLETPPVPANPSQGNQPAQSNSPVQPAGNFPLTNPRYPAGDLGAAQPLQSGG